MTFALRAATVDDVDFLWEMLYEASYAAENGVSDVAALRAHPELGRYVEGWGARTDLGVLGRDRDSGQPAGAAWLRLLTGDAKGYGYLDDDTPELALAVVPAHRGRGLGARLLREVLDAAAGRFESVSLSVRADNPARRLYERTGFRIVGDAALENAPVGTSITMTIDLRSGGATGRSPPRC